MYGFSSERGRFRSCREGACRFFQSSAEGMSGRPGLLVSVRSRGSRRLGRWGRPDRRQGTVADLWRPMSRSIEEIIAAVAGRVPSAPPWVSWLTGPMDQSRKGVAFVKWGTGRTSISPTARVLVNRPERSVGNAEPVLVAYADHARADSPDPRSWPRLHAGLRFPAFLIDTAVKDGSTLLDWLRPSEIDVECGANWPRPGCRWRWPARWA